MLALEGEGELGPGRAHGGSEALVMFQFIIWMAGLFVFDLFLYFIMKDVA